MKIKLSIIILFSFVFFKSQIISGKILNKQGESISNARIGIENTNIGDISDKNGNYEINLENINQDEYLKVIVNEYLPFKTKVKDWINSNHNILLTEKIINIEPVVINPKKYKFKNLGTTKLKGAYCGYNSENKNRLFQEYAIKIKNNKNLKIKKINVNISTFDVEGRATLFFDVQNSTNGFPDDSKTLSNETLSLTISKDDIKDNKISLDVSDKNIWTNEDFFITVRVNEDLKGKLYFAGNIFAFSKETYYRNYFDKWQKFSSGEPSINVDVQIEK